MKKFHDVSIEAGNYFDYKKGMKEQFVLLQIN